MKRLQQYMIDAGGLALATFIRNWMSTLRYQCAFYDPTVDPIHPRFRGPVIYIFWHEYIPFMFYLRGHCQIAMLVSQHKDAELLSRAAGIMGFSLVRGSSRRGAITALRRMLRLGQLMNLTLTPDGPRGPRRQLAPGCLYLASKLRLPIVPLGLGYEDPWRNRRAWDHFAIPKPGSRACAVVGPALHIPSNLDRNSIDVWRIKTENILNHLTELAESSASTGRTFVNSIVTDRACPPSKIFRTKRSSHLSRFVPDETIGDEEDEPSSNAA